MFAAVVWIIDPSSSTTIIVIDCLLIALILAFRFTKEMRFVTPDDAYTIDRSRRESGSTTGTETSA